jgi:hypothetical protein
MEGYRRGTPTGVSRAVLILIEWFGSKAWVNG